MKCQTRTLKTNTMENNIVILHAQEWNQHVMINFKTYEFEFDLLDLTNHILEKYSTREIDAIIGLDPEDHSYEQMAKILAENWDHNDVETLISDFIKDNQENLIDHLQITKN